MTNKVLILGGNGFIGQHVTIESLNRGFDVYNLSQYDTDVLYDKNKVSNIYCDILNMSQLKKSEIPKLKFKYIINCLGIGDHSGFWNGGLSVIKSHYFGLLNILDLINYKSIDGFVQLGTSDAYGDHISPQEENLREKPLSPYSAAKTASSHLLQMLYRTEGFPVKILRLFLPYGPGQGGNMLLPQIIKGCLNNQKFPVSLGEQYRDFLYIDDLVAAIFISLNKNKANGEVINIGYGQPIRIKELILKIQKIIGTGIPQFGEHPYRKCENMSLYPSIKKANDILNWHPSIHINDGIKETIKYYREKLK